MAPDAQLIPHLTAYMKPSLAHRIGVESWINGSEKQTVH